MPSYRLAPLPNIDLKAEEVSERIKELSARKSDEELKRGTLPETFRALSEDVFCFDFGFQIEYEALTLDGPEKRVRLEKVPVVFLSGEILAVGNCNKDTRNEILNFLQKGLSLDYSLETIEFKEEILRKVLGKAPNLLKAKFKPEQKWERPEEVSGRDRDLRQTELWQEYEGEPLSKIKVELSGGDEDIMAGFGENGVLVIHGRSIPISKQVAVLNSIAENIISEVLKRQTYQRSLG